MKLLSEPGQAKAKATIFEVGRPLEQALYEYHFANGSAEAVCAALSAFRNDDGGFGHALEPDLRLPDSSALATTFALETLSAIEATEGHSMVRGAISYLSATIDDESGAWPIIPANADDAPHAPWWVYDGDMSAHLANPRAEILGYLHTYSRLAPHDLIARLDEAVLSHLKEHAGSMVHHDLLCYVRLAECDSLPPGMREEVVRTLGPALEREAATDPAAWGSYGLMPLDVAPSPNSPFASMFADAVSVQLDYEIDRLEGAGWAPNWSWGEAYPEAFEQAARDWTGVFTLSRLRSVHLYGRLG